MAYLALAEGIIVNHPVYCYQMGNQFFEHHPKVLKNLIDADTLRSYYILEDGPKSMSSFLEEWEKELTIKQIRTKIEKLVGPVLIKSARGVEQLTTLLIKVNFKNIAH